MPVLIAVSVCADHLITRWWHFVGGRHRLLNAQLYLPALNLTAGFTILPGVDHPWLIIHYRRFDVSR